MVVVYVSTLYLYEAPWGGRSGFLIYCAVDNLACAEYLRNGADKLGCGNEDKNIKWKVS